jgi:hypothetical protein
MTCLPIPATRINNATRFPSGALRNMAHTFSQDVLYVQSIKPFYGTRIKVILFTPIRKVWPSLRQFLQNSEILKSIMFRSVTSNFTQI